MRLTLWMITGFLALAGVAQAQAQVQAQASTQVSVESFTWERNARFDLRMNQKGGAVTLKGDLRDGARELYTTKDGRTTVEIKSYTTELFVVIAVMPEGDDSGYIFLLERPQTEWIVMNDTPIRSRKLDLMTDFETAVKDFKVVTNHTFANVLRKMVEYFEKYPTKRLQDLLSSLETKDPFLNALPRPRAVAKNNDQGVIPGKSPREARTTPERDPNGPPTTPPPDSADDDQPRGQVRRPSAPTAYRDRDAEDPWVRRERERQRALQRERRARELREQQMREQQGYGGYDAYGRPMPFEPRGYEPQRPRFEQRPPPQYRQPPGGFFDQMFGQ